jgi:antitoxin (DNA-binding transcriptional repressor) of toxin-antitoxin stability system
MSEPVIYTVSQLGAPARDIISQIRERGELALITDHGRFVAVITPLRDGEIEAQVLPEIARELQGRLVTGDTE